MAKARHADVKQADEKQKESVSLYQTVRPYLRGAAALTALGGIIVGTYDIAKERTLESVKPAVQGSANGFHERRDELRKEFEMRLSDNRTADVKDLAAAYGSKLRNIADSYGQSQFDVDKDVDKFEDELNEQQKKFTLPVYGDAVDGAKANFSASMEQSARDTAGVLSRELITDSEKYQIVRGVYDELQKKAAEYVEKGIKVDVPDFGTFIGLVTGEWARIETGSPAGIDDNYQSFLTREQHNDRVFKSEVEHLTWVIQAQIEDNMEKFLEKQIQAIEDYSDETRREMKHGHESTIEDREIENIEALFNED